MRKKLRLFRQTVRALTPAESKQAFAAGTEGDGTICGQCVHVKKKTGDDDPGVQTWQHTCDLLACGGGGGTNTCDHYCPPYDTVDPWHTCVDPTCAGA